ncbi:MAG TPA: type VII secretion protein EccB [Pseudonocardia sp.]|nr:type VII secretion protein EccB [Pseudonocardia sp.]
MRAPATRDQADAYRFGLRRLEAALVRGDPVPLHEHLRAQRRAALVGVLLGMLGLCGAAVYALVVPRPDWRAQAVVVGAGSGALYVVAHRPDRLVPVANLPAARLVLAALRNGGASDTDPGTAAPVLVPDDVLEPAARTAAAAVPGALAVDPGRPGPASGWAVCDEVDPDGRVVASTVVGGVAAGPPAGSDGVLLAGRDGATWLVTAGRRHRVDLADGRVLAAYGLVRAAPRDASPALLAVLPEGPALVPPTVSGRGTPAPAGLPGRVGDVLVAQPVRGPAQYFVVLSRGVQQVPELVARMQRALSPAGSIRPVPLELVATAPLSEQLPVQAWPPRAPRMLDALQASTLCWSWAENGSGGIRFGTALPVPVGTRPVRLAGADGAGPLLDAVAVGAGGAVRATGPDRAAGADPVWLISATGVGYVVADAATAAALGVAATAPAPEAVLRLLPTGPALDLGAAERLLDLGPRPR